MTIHTLKPDEHTLHGAFSRSRPPVVTILPGDTVVGAVPDAGWGMEAPHLDRSPRQYYKRPEKPEEGGHALIGPVAIEGAKPGMTLVVHIERLVPGTYGFTMAGGFPHRIHSNLGFDKDGEELLVWSLDAQANIATTQHGHRVRMAPFLGVMGVAPPDEGFHDTAPPRIWGGNIDCRDLVAGTRLYLPVAVDGALFSFGDGHAAQGHGEVSVTAIECPMDRVELRFELLSDLKLTGPRAWTPSGWLTFGFHDQLERASLIALDEMITLMMTLYPLSSRKQALALATAVVDLHVTQIANPAAGVHAYLPHDAFVDPA